MAENTHITLKSPIKAGDGSTITRIDVRALKRKDSKDCTRKATILGNAAMKTEERIDHILLEDLLLNRATGIAIEDLDELSLEDSAALQQTFQRVNGTGGDAAGAGQATAADSQAATE